MILPKRKLIEKNWDMLLSGLQAIRGQGKWRGSFLQMRSKGELRIPFEAADNFPVEEYATIMVKAELDKIHAVFSNGKDSLFLKDFDMKVDNFLEEILKEVKQRTYIRTNKDKANYRG